MGERQPDQGQDRDRGIRLDPAEPRGAEHDAEHDLEQDRRQPDPGEEAGWLELAVAVLLAVTCLSACPAALLGEQQMPADLAASAGWW